MGYLSYELYDLCTASKTLQKVKKFVLVTVHFDIFVTNSNKKP